MSDLYDRMFRDARVLGCFSAVAHVQAMLDVEAALAEAVAEVGLIPATAATTIRAVAKAEHFDLEILRDESVKSGNLAIPLVEQLTNLVASTDPNAACFVHWGATSQDIIDTSLVLQLRASLPIVIQHLDRGVAAALQHARRHIDTPMPGRTWLQHATPITFGLKAAGWADALDRVRTNLRTALQAASVLQFGGAAGTAAALGTSGPNVARAMGTRLSLAVPDLPWHAHRDRLAHVSVALGLVAGTLGKVGRDLGALAQTEVGEAHEGRGGGSSTMPNKRNPRGAAVALAASIRIPGLVSTVLAAMPQEHERGLGGWQAEWETIPEIVQLTAGSSRAIAEALEALVVDPERMAANLLLSGGLAMAEAVSMALAEHLGRREAHSLVDAACRKAQESRRPLADVLKDEAAVAPHLTPLDIDRLLAPAGYLGAARAFVDRVLLRLSPNSDHHA